MLLVSAKVGPFRSIDEAQTVQVDPAVTALVGMNEAGKTVFLQALTKCGDALGVNSFDHIEDFPRKNLSAYLKVHATQPAIAAVLTYRLSDEEVKAVNREFSAALDKDFVFSFTHTYNNKHAVSLHIDEKPVLKALLRDAGLSGDASGALKGVATIRAVPEALEGISLTEGDKAFLTAIEARIAKATKAQWSSVVEFEVSQWLSTRLPRFLYFGDYQVLESKISLAELAAQAEHAKANPKVLDPGNRGALALLRMADISLEDFSAPGGYEPLKAKIEAVSISLTDQIMNFWKQNEDLEVEVDIKADPTDKAPFNNGPNLYLRIKNRRHRGVSTPFRHRSRGFIWFFSFLVWFDSVQQQLETAQPLKRDLILLLDEPGLSLHALAQQDFLRYIDELSSRHQIVYSTHSPFMVHSDRLAQVRTVEDKLGQGTVISSEISSSDTRTLFPLQAALGYTIAQNLFISERNLLVEGPSELIYLQGVSSTLESMGRTGLRSDITIVPTGGLDKVATFVALLGANGLKLAVLYDYKGSPDQRLMDLVKSKILSAKAVLDASQFRDLGNLGVSGPASDIEDLFPLDLYLDLFNATFKKQLPGALEAKDLPKGDRAIDRLERHLAARNVELRKGGGFNHYRVASWFASNPPKLDPVTLDRFEALFRAVNGLL